MYLHSALLFHNCGNWNDKTSKNVVSICNFYLNSIDFLGNFKETYCAYPTQVIHSKSQRWLCNSLILTLTELYKKESLTLAMSTNNCKKYINFWIIPILSQLKLINIQWLEAATYTSSLLSLHWSSQLSSVFLYQVKVFITDMQDNHHSVTIRMWIYYHKPRPMLNMDTRL